MLKTMIKKNITHTHNLLQVPQNPNYLLFMIVGIGIIYFFGTGFLISSTFIFLYFGKTILFLKGSLIEERIKN